MSSINEYLIKLCEQVDALKSRLEFLTRLSDGSSDQKRALLYFLDRAAQCGEACSLAAQARLNVPVGALARIVSDDLLWCNWVSLSDENATRYIGEVTSEFARLARLYIKEGQARIVDRSTGEDRTGEVDFDKLVSRRLSSKRIATDSGLAKVYQIAFRMFSLEVHGKLLLPFSGDDATVGSGEAALAAHLPAIIAMLKAILLVVDRRFAGQSTPPDEILRIVKV
ncbi:MAG: hypothetical protein ACLQDM_09780 [Bradyrhizobium sp.]